MSGKGDNYRIRWSKDYAEKYNKIFKKKRNQKKTKRSLTTPLFYFPLS